MSRSAQTRTGRKAAPIAPIGTIFPIIPMDISTGTALDAFDELLNNILGNKQKVRDIFKNKIGYPKTDIYIDRVENEIVLEMSIPGLSKEEIEIVYENESLCVKSIKAEKEVKEKDRKYIVRELKHSSFIRSWLLPTAELDIDKEFESSLENGILTIRVPLKEEEKPKTIQVKIK